MSVFAVRPRPRSRVKRKNVSNGVRVVRSLIYDDGTRNKQDVYPFYLFAHRVMRRSSPSEEKRLSALCISTGVLVSPPAPRDLYVKHNRATDCYKLKRSQQCVVTRSFDDVRDPLQRLYFIISCMNKASSLINARTVNFDWTRDEFKVSWV